MAGDFPGRSRQTPYPVRHQLGGIFPIQRTQPVALFQHGPFKGAVTVVAGEGGGDPDFLKSGEGCPLGAVHGLGRAVPLFQEAAEPPLVGRAAIHAPLPELVMEPLAGLASRDVIARDMLHQLRPGLQGLVELPQGVHSLGQPFVRRQRDIGIHRHPFSADGFVIGHIGSDVKLHHIVRMGPSPSIGAQHPHPHPQQNPGAGIVVYRQLQAVEGVGKILDRLPHRQGGVDRKQIGFSVFRRHGDMSAG